MAYFSHSTQDAHFGVKASLWIYSNPSNSIDTTLRLEQGWLQKHVGLGRNTDASTLTVQDFLQKTKSLLAERRVTHVLNIWIGTSAVFRSKQGSADANLRNLENNLESAFAAAASYKGDQINTRDAGVWARGFGEEFETDFRFVLRRKNDPSSPLITLQVLALPVDLSWTDGESLLDHIARLNEFLDDKMAVRSENERVKAQMGGYLERLQDSLKRTYGATETRYEFNVDLGSIVW